ncbi:MAG: hypothetical protein EZS28_045943, partial [Streblomastix strix]
PVSRRSKPSSRSLLVGEQSNTWRILLRNDRKSRHRRIKKRRRYERLAATSQLSLLGNILAPDAAPNIIYKLQAQSLRSFAAHNAQHDLLV